MHKPARRSMASGIPPLIKRNTALFALTLAFTGSGMQFAFLLGPLMVIAIMGSATWSGIAVGLVRRVQRNNAVLAAKCACLARE